MTIQTQVILHKRLHPTHLIQEIESDDYNKYEFKIRNTQYKAHEQRYSIQSNSIIRKNRSLKLLKANRGSVNVSTCSNPLSVKACSKAKVISAYSFIIRILFTCQSFCFL